MGDDFGRHSQIGGQALFENGGEGMGIADRCEAREQKVNLDDLAIAGGSEADTVVLNIEFIAEGVEALANLAACFRIGVVEQADRGLPDEAAARPENVHGNNDGYDGIEWLPVCEQDQAPSRDNAETGPTVGQDVLAVGFKNEGIGAAAGADEVVAKSRVNDSSDQDEHEARTEALELEPCHPFVNGLEENGDSGHDDQGAFKAGGKEGDSLVTVEEMMGGRPGAEAKAEACKAHGDDVNDGLGGVREDGRGMGHEIGRKLANEHGKANDEREAHGELRGLQLMLVSVWRRVVLVLRGH